MNIHVLYNESASKRRLRLLQSSIAEIKKRNRIRTLLLMTVGSPLILLIFIGIGALMYSSADVSPTVTTKDDSFVVWRGFFIVWGVLALFALINYFLHLGDVLDERVRYAKRSQNAVVTQDNSYSFAITVGLLGDSNAQKLLSNYSARGRLEELFFGNEQSQFLDKLTGKDLEQLVAEIENSTRSYGAARAEVITKFRSILRTFLGAVPVDYERRLTEQLIGETSVYIQSLQHSRDLIADSVLKVLDDKLDLAREHEARLQQELEESR